VSLPSRLREGRAAAQILNIIGSRVASLAHVRGSTTSRLHPVALMTVLSMCESIQRVARGRVARMEKLLFPIVNAALRVAGYDCIYSWSEFSAQIEGRLSSPRAFDFRIEDQRQETWRKIMRHPGAKTALAKLTHRLGHLVAPLQPVDLLIDTAIEISRDMSPPFQLPGVVSPSDVPKDRLRTARRRTLDLSKDLKDLRKRGIPPGNIGILRRLAARGADPSGFAEFERLPDALAGFADFLQTELRWRDSRRWSHLRNEDFLAIRLVETFELPQMQKDRHWRMLPEIATLLTAAARAGGSKRRFTTDSLRMLVRNRPNLREDARREVNELRARLKKTQPSAKSETDLR
jgi:hypothetical protein